MTLLLNSMLPTTLNPITIFIFSSKFILSGQKLWLNHSIFSLIWCRKLNTFKHIRFPTRANNPSYKLELTLHGESDICRWNGILHSLEKTPVRISLVNGFKCYFGRHAANKRIHEKLPAIHVPWLSHFSPSLSSRGRYIRLQHPPTNP